MPALIAAKKHNTVSSPQTIQLAAHQTRVFDLRDDFPNGNQFINAEILALSLKHSGANDALLARVLVAEPQRGYSNVVQFSNPNGGKSSEYQGVGFQIEDIDGIRFAPVVVARNVGTTAATVTVRVPYKRTDGTRGTITLPQKQLAAGRMDFINTLAILTRVQQEQIKVASLEVEYNTASGSVVVAAHSVSEDHNQVFRVPMWDPLAQRSPTGGYPWRIEGTSVTETYIKNITDDEEDYVAYLVWENDGIYMLGLKPIAAHETVHIDVKKLRDEQIPDERGRTIPLHVSSRQLQWTLRRKDKQPADDTRANLALIGRSEQVDKTKGISNNYACQNCCESTTTGFITANPNAVNFENPTYDLEVGDTIRLYAYEAIYYCYFQSGDYPEIYYKSTDDWESDDNNIATVTSSGVVTVVGPGEVEIDPDWLVTNSIKAEDCPLLAPEIVSTEQCEEQSRKEEAKTPDSESLSPNCGTCFSSSRLVNPEVNISARKLEILRNGQVISDTNSPVQNVVVGERIDLTTTITTTTGTIGLGTIQVGETPADTAFALHYGKPFVMNQAGIRFNGSVTLPNGVTGEIIWVQVVNSRRTRTPNVGRQQVLEGIGLDTVFPYEEPNQSVTEDSPLEILDPPCSYKAVSATDSLTMWLLFKPEITNGTSIYVPLNKVVWSWSATGTRGVSCDSWTLTNSTHSPNSTGVETTEHPQWTANITQFDWRLKSVIQR